MTINLGKIMSLRLAEILRLASISTALAFSNQAAQAGPLSDPIIVNTYTQGNQILLDQASAINGDQIVLWSDGSSGDASFVQIYNVVGSKRFTNDRYVGTNASALGIDKVGNFVVLSSQPDGGDVGVFATLYDASANMRVSTFRVNQTVLGAQVSPKIAMTPEGGFFVAWMSYSSAGGAVFARKFSATGAALTNEIQVTPVRRNQALMSVASDPAGNVIFSGWRVESGNSDVWLRRYNASGAPLSGEVIVNTYTVNAQTGGSVATDRQGNSVAIWQSYGQDGVGWSIYGQRFDSYGTRSGTPFRVTPDIYDQEPDAKVAMTSDGSFVVTWLTDNRIRFPTSKPVARARQFRPDGSPIAADFLVSSNTDANAWSPLVSVDRAGQFLIGWRNLMSTANYDAMVRRYGLDNLPPFRMIVNGQTISSLSSAAGGWLYFKINVPVGTRALYLTMTGPVAAGNADMYLNFGAFPTTAHWEIRPYLTGSNESVQINNPPAGDWYIGVNARTAYSGVSLTARLN